MKCSICKGTEQVRLYGVTVDGWQQDGSVPLCRDHGDRYLIVLCSLIGLLIYTGGEVRE